MKKIVLMLMAVIPAVVFAQTPDNFTVKGKVGNLSSPAKVYFGYAVDGKDVLDSAAIINGEFSFHGYLKSTTSAAIVIDPKGLGLSHLNRNSDLLNFYIEKANIVLTSPDLVANATITGSKVNDDNKRMIEALKPANAAARAVLAEADSASDALKISPDFQNSVQRKYKVAQMEEEAQLRKFITENPNSFVSLTALGTLDNPSANIFEIEKMFNALSPEVRATETGVAFRKSLDIAKATAVGSIAPDFTQSDSTGRPISLSSLRGKYVLIDFWASWCGPCRLENPNVVKVYNQYKSKNFTVLGVSLDKETGRAAWIKAIKDDGLVWQQVSDLKFWANQVAVLYKVSQIPQNYLIDPSGKIIAKNLRGEELNNKLAEILR
jgi:peroxiredoxin